MKVLVCGGRYFTDYTLLEDALADLPPITHIIHGGARGADSLADRFADENFIWCTEFKADWGKHGKAAGPIRNQQMLDEGKPDLVVAFPGGVGTADMVRRAKKAGVKTIEIPKRQ